MYGYVMVAQGIGSQRLYGEDDSDGGSSSRSTSSSNCMGCAGGSTQFPFSSIGSGGLSQKDPVLKRCSTVPASIIHYKLQRTTMSLQEVCSP